MSKAETDIILNRTNVALSRSQRLVASWLPPKTQEEAENPPKSEEEMRAEEEDIFTPVPETYAFPLTKFIIYGCVYVGADDEKTRSRSPPPPETCRWKLEPRGA